MVNWCKRTLDCLGGDSFRTQLERERNEIVTTSGDNDKKAILQLKLLEHQEPLNSEIKSFRTVSRSYQRVNLRHNLHGRDREED